MNGVHDLGGTDGLGTIGPEENEPVFHSEWEKVVFALLPATFAAGYYNLDQFRHGIEQMHPVEYLSSRYYEHWLHTITHHAIRVGAIDPDELDERTRYYRDNPDAPLPDRRNPELLKLMETIVAQGSSARRPLDSKPRFSIGDRVRVADDHPFGHTRRARYIRGKVGVIDRVHGTFIYPDTAARGEGDDPQWVYSVRFDAKELWGEQYADANGSVYFDVWEPYIDRV
ncbi:nitrile hydratase [Carbonactinospora thermoautotrophica]|uniref:Nitrile hydratase subunit beta n=1 Tax=Carbonactinospora thermoautotrophica TaxID=1469144 RepID=A0A132MU48_9ACTN|nr:nitrile hydratase subunit beta [Carbonactinospora thermoautotrophica]KWX01266.1 Nitrile hydratase [Carbonactinospora thermoautotrophica]KWX05755.1 nitrile hydratase [Carbonactinospora thermoautotrophica]KWX07717.1 nitrile hydratase [Carbonactinospora thermoautotrophica]